MNKSAEAFRTIGEVADELEVPKHVLRFWEGKFPQIRPMKRGGGRRYYRPEDMELLRGIRHLLHAEGYTIKGVQKILREQGIEQVKALVRQAMEEAGKVGGKRPARKTVSASRGTAATAREKAAEPQFRDGLARSPSMGHARAGKDAPRDLIAAIIKELEACRAALALNPAAHTAAETKRARAGGRS